MHTDFLGANPIIESATTLIMHAGSYLIVMTLHILTEYSDKEDKPRVQFEIGSDNEHDSSL